MKLFQEEGEEEENLIQNEPSNFLIFFIIRLFQQLYI
jgi:hypothetical protein